MNRLLFAFIVDPKEIEIFRKAQDIQINQFPIYGESVYAFSIVNGLVPTMRTVNTGLKEFNAEKIIEYIFKFAASAGIQYVALLRPNMIVTRVDNLDPHGKVPAYKMARIDCAGKPEINKMYRLGTFSPKKEEITAEDVYIFNVSNKELKTDVKVSANMPIINLVEKPAEVVKPKVKFGK